MLFFGLTAGARVSSGAAMGPGTNNSKSSDALVQLRDEPLLQKPVTGEFRNPKAQDLVDLVRTATGQRISLAPGVIQDRPIQGHTKISKVPAWAVLANLAQNPYIKGRWIKDGEEYILVPTYTGSPPSLPPELPPRLRQAMDRTEKGIPPTPDPNRAPPDVARRIPLTGISLVFLAVFCVLHFWRRKSEVRATERSRPKEKST